MRLNSSSVKKGVVKNVANFTGKHLRCETFKDTYFEEYLRTTASEIPYNN